MFICFYNSNIKTYIFVDLIRWLLQNNLHGDGRGGIGLDVWHFCREKLVVALFLGNGILGAFTFNECFVFTSTV
jgi:hypothetical protein